ncbi:MAG TPA: ABC transporter permease [Alphaproteobacteria bacterium]|nr:ABC transporter permease [Alphaproteobacteria bacterium]
MLGYAAKRGAMAILVALTVSVICFLLVNLSTDIATAVAGEGARAEDIEFIRKQYGFDRPLIVQYLDWLSRAITGDFGDSLYFRSPAADVVWSRLPTTLILGALALSFALILSIPLGVVAALKPNSWLDRLTLTIAVIGQAMPSFWFALLLIMLFGLTLRWLPISGSETWAHFVMPAVALGYYATPGIMRLTRAGMLEVLASDYIRTARAKGLRAPSVLFKHALRNAAIPVVALAAVQLGFMLGGSVVIETIFALHGLGYLAWESILHNDFPVVQAIVLLISLIYILLTFVADMLNAWLDPRIRIG